jgi:hypothetical protein
MRFGKCGQIAVRDTQNIVLIDARIIAEMECVEAIEPEAQFVQYVRPDAGRVVCDRIVVGLLRIRIGGHKWIRRRLGVEGALRVRLADEQTARPLKLVVAFDVQGIHVLAVADVSRCSSKRVR